MRLVNKSGELIVLESIRTRFTDFVYDRQSKVEDDEKAIRKYIATFAQSPEASLLESMLVTSSEHGLTDTEVEKRLYVDGPNILPADATPRWWMLFLKAVPNAFNILLAVLATIAISTGDQKTFGVLMVMLTAAIVIRFWQEWKSTLATAKLLMNISHDSRVIRNGRECIVANSMLVAGDICVFSSGDTFPADMIVLESIGLVVNQGMLTGESYPVEKGPRPKGEYSDCILDLPHVCFMGTHVVSGSGRGVIISSGSKNYINCLAAGAPDSKPTAFTAGIQRVAMMFVVFMLIMAPLVLVVNGTSTQNWKGAALFALAVAVGLTPEMLPMIVTTNLARGALQMARCKAIVKKIDSVQSLGGITVLCSDKTGTLTRNETEVECCMGPDGNKSDRVMQLAHANASRQTGNVNHLDKAILHTFEGTPLNCTNAGELPFDFERRRVSVLVSNKSGLMLVTKGAFEEVVSVCSHYDMQGSVLPIDDTARAKFADQATRMNEMGFRVLAVTTRFMSTPKISVSDETQMVFEGLICFSDPPKEDAARAITALRNNGVAVKILTGDALSIANRVAATIGVSSNHIAESISGPELDVLNKEEFMQTCMRCTVFAKLTPIQKLKVIRAIQAHGHRVGFLGDGVNDAAALRASDVGISVDNGTAVAKQAAHIILLEKNLSVIAEGIRLGRISQGNTIKYIQMALGSNFGNVFSILIAAAWLKFDPMKPLQLLLQNLLYDLSQISIPWDTVDEEYIAAPQDWKSLNIVRFALFMGPLSSIFDVTTFLVNIYYYGIEPDCTDEHLISIFQTQWFLVGICTQLLVILAFRSAKLPFFQSNPSTPVALTISFMAVVGNSIPYIAPIRESVAMSIPYPSFYGFWIVFCVSYFLATILGKAVYIRAFNIWL